MSAHHIDITSGGRCYRLDLAGKSLYREKDERVRLSRQQWDLLNYFVENSGTLLSKDQLQENVWNRIAVTDEAISLAVRALRRALKDNKDNPDFIETVHGQGYRFIAHTEHFVSRDDEPPDRNEPLSRPPPAETVKYSDGDWITAAIVGPERAENWLKGAAARLNRQFSNDRTVESVENYIEAKIRDLVARHERGGTTDDAKLEGCVAKVVSDILARELETFLWNVSERPDSDDPISIFRDTVREFTRKIGSGRWLTKANEARPRNSGDDPRGNSQTILTYTIDWLSAPYGTLTIHFDIPIVEKYVGDWFYRGRESQETPKLYSLLLDCPGIDSVSRKGPYALLLGHSEMATLEKTQPCIDSALREAIGGTVVYGPHLNGEKAQGISNTGENVQQSTQTQRPPSSLGDANSPITTVEAIELFKKWERRPATCKGIAVICVMLVLKWPEFKPPQDDMIAAVGADTGDCIEVWFRTPEVPEDTMRANVAAIAAGNVADALEKLPDEFKENKKFLVCLQGYGAYVWERPDPDLLKDGIRIVRRPKPALSIKWIREAT
jgi:DNA-binding winged helix-turn-helix (wHTH) protein